MNEEISVKIENFKNAINICHLMENSLKKLDVFPSKDDRTTTIIFIDLASNFYGTRKN